MHYAVSVNFEGTAHIDEKTGICQIAGLAGGGGPPESTDDWRIIVEADWPAHEHDAVHPATIHITGPFGGSLQGAYRHGGLNDVTDGSGRGQACMLDMDFEVTGSSGRFAGSRGTIRRNGTVLVQDAFLLTADLVLEAPATAWLPPNSGLLTADELASGASHVALQFVGQPHPEAAPDPFLHQPVAGQEQLLPSAPSQTLSLHQHQNKQGELSMEHDEQERHPPPGVTSGSPERPTQQVDAPWLAFDLAAEIAQLHNERSWATTDRDAKTLIKEADLRLVLIVLKAGARLAQHETVGRAVIHLIEGQLRVRLSGLAKELVPGDLLAIERDVSHEVEGVDDSAFLLTVAMAGDA